MDDFLPEDLYISARDWLPPRLWLEKVWGAIDVVIAGAW